MDGTETEAFYGSMTDRSCRNMDHRRTVRSSLDLPTQSSTALLPRYFLSFNSPSSSFSSSFYPYPQPQLTSLRQKLNCFCFTCASLVRSRDRVQASRFFFLFHWHICPSTSETTTFCPSGSLHDGIAQQPYSVLSNTQQWMPYFASPRPCALS